VKYGITRLPLSMEEIAGRAGVPIEFVQRYILASLEPNEAEIELAFEGLSPEQQALWEEMESQEARAALMCDANDHAMNQIRELRTFVAYAAVCPGVVADGDIRPMVEEALAVLEWVAKVQRRTHERRIKRPSKKLRKLEAQLATIKAEPPSSKRELRTISTWSQVAELTNEGQLYDVADLIFPNAYDRSNIWEHMEFWSDPTSLYAVPTEHLRRNHGNRKGKEATPEAITLLREHFLALVDCQRPQRRQARSAARTIPDLRGHGL